MTARSRRARAATALVFGACVVSLQSADGFEKQPCDYCAARAKEMHERAAQMRGRKSNDAGGAAWRARVYSSAGLAPPKDNDAEIDAKEADLYERTARQYEDDYRVCMAGGEGVACTGVKRSGGAPASAGSGAAAGAGTGAGAEPGAGADPAAIDAMTTSMIEGLKSLGASARDNGYQGTGGGGADRRTHVARVDLDDVGGASADAASWEACPWAGPELRNRGGAYCLPNGAVQLMDSAGSYSGGKPPSRPIKLPGLPRPTDHEDIKQLLAAIRTGKRSAIVKAITNVLNHRLAPAAPTSSSASPAPVAIDPCQFPQWISFENGQATAGPPPYACGAAPPAPPAEIDFGASP